MEHSYFKWEVPKGLLPLVNDDDSKELIYDEPFSEYLADREHLNSGGAVQILDSPKMYISGLLGYNKSEEEPDHFRFGRAAHMAILEPDKFRQYFLEEPEFIGLTKEGKESSQSAEARTKKKKWYEDLPPDALVLSSKELTMLTEMIDCLMDHPQAGGMFRNGRPEVTGRFLHLKYKIRCKIRPDYLTKMPDGRIYFFDLKTARSVEPGIFATDAARLKYHCKMAFYWDGLTEILGQEPEACALVPIEKGIPSRTQVYWLNDQDLEDGRRQNHFAMETLLKCIAENKWPRRKSWGQMLSLPARSYNEPLPEYDWGNDGTATDADQYPVQPEGSGSGDMPV